MSSYTLPSIKQQKKSDSNLASLALKTLDIIFLIYQTGMSSLVGLGGNCRFSPSCSEYSRQAFKEFGLVKGTVLTFKRVGRCHPLGPYGYDPLPEKHK